MHFLVASNLSPFAKEFVPQQHPMNPTAKDFIPKPLDFKWQVSKTHLLCLRIKRHS